jgi:hypothetical protein
MIRKFAAVIALAVLPTIAAAQTPDASPGLIIRGLPPDSYSLTLDVAGKAPSTVSREIWDAAYTVCTRAPTTGDRTELTVDNWANCVNEAVSGAVAQYDQIRAGR